MLRWRLKVLVQFILAHVPGGERLNYLLQVLTGGHSETKTASRIMGYATRLRTVDEYRTLEGATVLEMGTGWEPTATILMYLMGSEQVVTYDHVRHLRFTRVRQLVEQMALLTEALAPTLSRSPTVLDRRLVPLLLADDLETLLAAARIRYEAPADAAHSGLPDKSVDVFCSYAVLAHVPKSLIGDITVEARRVLKDGGIVHHVIGLQDPYAKPGWGVNKVNFLRYSDRWWAFFVNNRISSNNRLRERQYIDIFRANGASIERQRSETDPRDVEAVKAMRVDRHFANMTPEELAVTHTELTMSFPRSYSASADI